MNTPNGILFSLNTEKIINSNYSNIVKAAAASVYFKSYYTTGEFFKSLKDFEKESLFEKSSTGNCEDELMLLVLILSKGEGLHIQDYVELGKYYTVLSILITYVYKYKNSDVDFDKMSLDMDLSKLK